MHPHMEAIFFDGSNILFEKGHISYNLVKLFQILTSVFAEEDFLRICSCPYSAKSLPTPPKEHSYEIISKSKAGFQRKDFLRISSCPYSAKVSPPPPPPHGGHVFRQIQIS